MKQTNVTLPKIQNTVHSNNNATHRSVKEETGNMMKTNHSYNTNITGTVYNPDNKDASNMKKKLFILEDYYSDVGKQMDEHKKEVDKLNDSQLAAKLYINDYFKRISKNVYDELQKVEDYTETEFLKQDLENKKKQSQIDEEKNEFNRLNKKYLELMSRLSNLYTYVGLDNTHLEMK